MSENRTEITKETAKDGTESISYRKEWKKNGINHSKQVRKVEDKIVIYQTY